MNKPMDAEAPRMTEKQFLRMIGEPVPFEGTRAKERAKHARRVERRNRRIEKTFWLNS